MGEQYLTQQQAAERLGVSRVTLAKRIREGRVATFISDLDHRTVLIPIDAIERLRQPRPHIATRVAMETNELQPV